jgi:hypothetical protein
MRTVLAVAVTLALLPAGAFARGKAVEINNPTIELTTRASPSQVKKAVKLAVLSRGWTISNEKAGAFDATYSRANRRDNLMAKIHVSYDTHEVKVKYVTSEGLGADGDSIHPTYNKWIDMLARDIPIYVEREKAASE